MNDINCIFCKNEYSSKNALNRHIRLKHFGSAVYVAEDCIPKMNCKLCQNKYGSKKALNHHIRLKHPESVAELCIPSYTRTRKDRYICSTCDLRFSSKRSLKTHIFSAHFVQAPPRQQNILCAFENCGVRLKNYNCYYIHLLSIHDIEIKEKKIVFGNCLDFVQWKENYELQHNVSFIRTTGRKCRPVSGMYVEYYSCHRSYFPNITSGKRTKYVGSRKTGICCPCRMKVIVKKNETVAYFTDTHIGHTCDPEKISLKPTERRSIAQKLSEGASFEKILEDIDHSTTNCSTKSEMIKRLHLTDRQDLYNICREYNLLTTVTKHQNDDQNDHQNDLFSVKIWVEEMRILGNDNPVLYVKFQDEEDPVFEKEDFVLVLMTQFQQEMYLQFGNDLICINATNGLNSYDFYLYSLVTIDEFGNGVPIAFCLSNLKSNLVYETFFNSIKTQVGTVTPCVFMSDLEVAFYSAWESVMGAVKNELPCLWHIFNKWTENLNRITNVHKREFLKKVLRNLCYELDPEKFETCLEIFLEELENDEETHSFYIYFKNEWYFKQQQWAMCYRKCVGLSTNTVLESLHKQIKYFYLSGLTCKRLDKSIHALMKLANRDVFKYVIKVQPGKRTRKMISISKAHKSSANILDENVLLITDNLWSVLSESKKDILYEVTKINDTCPENSCGLKCTTCNICIHMYLCTCLDSTVRVNICKHIHAVCRVASSPVKQQVEENICILPSEDELDFYVSEMMEDNVVHLPDIMPTNDVKDEMPQILSKLHKAIEICHEIQILPSESEGTRQITRAVDNLLSELENLVQSQSIRSSAII